METIITAVQPTNKLTLGNYLGAIKNFISLSEIKTDSYPIVNKYACLIFVADLHAITIKYNTKDFKNEILTTLATYMACGLKEESLMFVQSHVTQHAELACILNSNSYMGELKRMHQFKEKSAEQGENISVGLFTYPVLMAADILLYNVSYVPVGEDQKQHMELTRNIAERMNGLYGKNTFTVPEKIVNKTGAKIKSLQNPLVKMSKSDSFADATIFLNDSNETIMKKFKKAVTDSRSEVVDDCGPGIENLFEIQSTISGVCQKDIKEIYLGKQYGILKKETGELVVQLIEPIRNKTTDFFNNPEKIMHRIHHDAAIASVIAETTLTRVRKNMGFL